MPGKGNSQYKIVTAGMLRAAVENEKMPIEVGWVTLDDFTSLSCRIIEESEEDRNHTKSTIDGAVIPNERPIACRVYKIKLYNARTRLLRPSVLVFRESMLLVPKKITMIEMRANFRASLPID